MNTNRQKTKTLIERPCFVTCIIFILYLRMFERPVNVMWQSTLLLWNLSFSHTLLEDLFNSQVKPFSKIQRLQNFMLPVFPLLLKKGLTQTIFPLIPRPFYPYSHTRLENYLSMNNSDIPTVCATSYLKRLSTQLHETTNTNSINVPKVVKPTK